MPAQTVSASVLLDGLTLTAVSGFAQARAATTDFVLMELATATRVSRVLIAPSSHARPSAPSTVLAATVLAHAALDGLVMTAR